LMELKLVYYLDRFYHPFLVIC